MREVALLSGERAAGLGRGGTADRAPRYWAFLSYSHKDSELADWLHGGLESYRVPRSLVGRESPNGVIPAGFSPIFRDRHELAASGDLGHTIREALAASRCLIVLCSPEAARSRWTNEEIVAFKKLHPKGCVLAAIVAGEPFASEMTGREAEECFPPALRQKFDGRGRPTGKRAEPIAADLRPTGDGRQLGLLKIVAGMLGVGLDDLVQRDQQRRQRRLTIIAAASLAGMVMTSGLAVFAFDKRDEARDQRREAEGLVGFMLGDLRQKLEPIGRLDALDAVGARALAYYQQQDKSGLSDEALAQRSKALTLMGEIANRRGDLDRALAHYREALAGTAESLRREPQDGDRIFNHAQNVFWVGSIALQRGRLGDAEAAFREYKSLADRLNAIAPGRNDWKLERVYADTNLGIVLLQKLNYRESSAAFASSLGDIEALTASEPRNGAYRDMLNEALAWLSQSREGEGALDEALGHRERQLDRLRQQAESAGYDTTVKRRMMVANRAIGRLFGQRGDTAQGLEHLQQSIRIATELMQTEPESTEWAELAAGSYLDLADLELAAGRSGDAGASTRTGCNIVNRLTARDSTVALWRITLRGECIDRRARLALNAGALQEARVLAAQAVTIARAEAAKTRSPDATMSLSAAQFLQAQVARAMGDESLARQSYRATLEALPAGVQMTPRRLARQMLALEGLGRKQDAEKIQARLSAMGFRHPSVARERQILRRVEA